MRFSAVAALCVAPLVLAGTLEQSLRARGALALEVARSEGPGNGDKGGAKQAVDDKGDKGSQKNNNNNGNVVIVQQQSTEVILIWVNQGNGAATQTVTNTVTVTQNGGAQGTGAAAAVATHSVCPPLRNNHIPLTYDRSPSEVRPDLCIPQSKLLPPQEIWWSSRSCPKITLLHNQHLMCPVKRSLMVSIRGSWLILTTPSHHHHKWRSKLQLISQFVSYKQRIKERI